MLTGDGAAGEAGGGQAVEGMQLLLNIWVSPQWQPEATEEFKPEVEFEGSRRDWVENALEKGQEELREGLWPGCAQMQWPGGERTAGCTWV